jgi:hypothetical protein
LNHFQIKKEKRLIGLEKSKQISCWKAKISDQKRKCGNQSEVGAKIFRPEFRNSKSV